MTNQKTSKYHILYDEEKIQWLSQNYGKATADEIAKRFNEKFGTDICGRTLISIVSHKKIPHTIEDDVKHYKYTREEREWIKTNIQKYDSWIELTDDLNRIFNKNYNCERVRELGTKRLKIKLGKNRSKYGLKKKEEYPLGTIKNGMNGTTYIKVKLVDGSVTRKTNNGYSEPYWKPLQKYIYEQTYGELKDDEFIIFLDGDNENYNLDNLCCVDKKIFGQLNLRGWYGHKELTKAMIEVIKTEIKLKEVLDND